MNGVRVGAVTIVPLVDTVLHLSVADMAPGVPEDVLRAESQAIDLAGETVHLPVTCHVLLAGDTTVLVDAGVGPRPRGDWDRGELDRRLAEAGIRPDDVDLVVNTHFHADHVGWFTEDTPAGIRPFFPRARYVLQRAEWEHWIPARAGDPGNEHLRECITALADVADLELVDGEVAITSEVRFVATPGHTPGHVAIGVASAGERALLVGDASHFMGQLHHPEWSPVWDADPALAARTRAALFERVEADPSTILGTSHWPFPGLGRIVRTGNRRVFASVELVG